ncbi:MAG TPA: stage 0 sporulation protein [Cyanobacteria bacterium UBA8530]|nr:stage 0 sporulation protein [Cyanobacteria bacterium UBA8530]
MERITLSRAAIRLRTGEVRLLEPNDSGLKRHQLVIYETEKGLDCSPIVLLPSAIATGYRTIPTVRYLRSATEADIAQLSNKWQEEVKAHRACGEKIALHSLPMKLVETVYTFDFARLTFFYTAEGRVDFRTLLKDLTATFRRTRIELRQIGVRDEAKLLSGVGPCGRELCCATFLREFVPITIKLAKIQGLPLNPNKISGLCGRLMCCLNYEHQTYQQIKAELPSVGTRIRTPDGEGVVIEQIISKEAVMVRVESKAILVKKDQILPALPAEEEKKV